MLPTATNPANAIVVQWSALSNKLNPKEVMRGLRKEESEGDNGEILRSRPWTFDKIH
ncbi:MAG: hypothetical protein HC908_05540 [Calothrix sp. SM1_7_51]|nr:hypothetical protein [Calothrix sp. SM1_7_51]